MTTSKAVRGIKGEDEKHFVIADEPEKMAEKTLGLLNDREKRRVIGEDARALIEQK